MRTGAGKAAGGRRTTSRVASAGCLAMLLGAIGCTTPLVYSPAAPERVGLEYRPPAPLRAAPHAVPGGLCRRSHHREFNMTGTPAFQSQACTPGGAI